MTSNRMQQTALIIVDFQEDFCPPHGALAVPNGRDIAPAVNQLLALPYGMKIATKDWHPHDHISFASSHADAGKVAFTSEVDVVNPHNEEEVIATRLWPDHCIQGSTGAQLAEELDTSRLDRIIEKGQHKHVEMYSAFVGPFRRPEICSSGLARTLRNADITHVHVVGLAMDYCVLHTALDSVREGFETSVISEGTRAVDPSAWNATTEKLHHAGVNFVKIKDVRQ